MNGLDRLAPVYPTLDGAVAAGGERREVQGEPRTAMIADDAARSGELLDSVVTSIFNAGMILQAAAGLPGEVTVRRIAEARRRFVRSACMCPATAGLFPCTQNRRGAVCARSGCFIRVQKFRWQHPVRG